MDGSTNNVSGTGVGVAVALGNVVGEGTAVRVGTTGLTVEAEGAQAERIKIMANTNNLFIGVLRNFVVKRIYYHNRFVSIGIPKNSQ
jgi:hypothetical protein